MNSPITPPAPAATLSNLGVLFHDSALVLRALARQLDSWFATRRQAEQDGQDLANMSDRELHDIGLSRGSFDPIASRPSGTDDMRL